MSAEELVFYPSQWIEGGRLHWFCPECETENWTEFIQKTVKCSHCGFTFRMTAQVCYVTSGGKKKE